MEELMRKQDKVSGHIIRSYENLKRIGQANLTFGTVEAKIETLDKQWAEFDARHDEVERLATAEDQKRVYFTNRVYESTEDAYFINKGKFLNLIRQFKQAEPQVARSAPATQQLPKINLPKFSGDFAEWPSFRDLFSSMVGGNTAIPTVEKLHYLKLSVTKEPSALLASIPLTAENYEPAWKVLTDRYENIRLLTNSQIANICSLQPMKSESSSELKALFNGTVNAVSALKSLGRSVEGYSDFLVYLTVQKLDKQSRREWESSMGSERTPPKFEALQTFLEARICAIQALEPVCSSAPPATKSSSSAAPPKGGSGPPGRIRSHQASSAPVGSKKCSHCQQEHYIVSCEGFRAKSIDERRAFVLANNLCLNCLGRHFVRECRSQKVCQVCKAKHHTMIHGPETGASGPPAPSAGAARDRSSQSSGSEAATPPVVSLAAHRAPCALARTSTRVLLATAIVNASSPGGAPVLVRALIDQGSEASFVSESLAQRLRLSRASASVTINGIGAKSALTSRGKVTLRISPRLESRFELEIGALVLSRLTSYSLPRAVVVSNLPHLEGLSLADPDFTATLQIDLLLGADVFSQLLLPGVRKGPLGAPVAQNTHLGWILSGRVSLQSDTPAACSSHQVSTELSLSSSLQRFWEQEEIPTPASLTAEEEKCEQLFVTSHSRDESGRYIVRLPLKDSPTNLGDSLSAASRMLARMEQRFARDSKFAEAYHSFRAEYESLHHMELAPASARDSAPVYYLPHHGVIRESSETTKLRVVFNGSQKTSTGVSLNDCLHVGPALLPELVDVMLRWRRHAIVFSADMEKMFRQILLHPDDRNFQRILWRKPSQARPEAFQLRTVTYGLACAPYLALRVIKQLATDERDRFPLGSASLFADVYVDDVLSGADNVASALAIQRETIELLKAGGFSLRKWASNSPDLLSHLPSSFLATGTRLDIPSEASFHMLGLSWRADDDCFVFELKPSDCKSPLTKRKVLSVIAGLFDPFGWLAPVVVKAKIFMQSLWLLKLGWDEPLPAAESQEWLTLYADLPQISSFRIPRWLNLQSTSQNIELHGFADASERAYAAVIYICVGEQARTAILVAAKTKVAPVKQVSLPRLELCAAHLLARLAKRVLEVLGVDCTVNLWSDSTITLAWIKGHPSRWKTYVANRVSEIQRALPNAIWRHVESQQNPSDCASRGLLASELRGHELWWSGPCWLPCDQDAWPRQLAGERTDPPEQRLQVHAAARESSEALELLTLYSSLKRLRRIVAWCLRYPANALHRNAQSRRRSPTLGTAELTAALERLLLLEQRRLCGGEMRALESRSALPRGPLLRLNPFLGEGQLLRVGGRLRHAVLDPDERHPIIVPRESPLARLLVDEVHRQTLHGGTQLTLATLRRRFWVVAGRSLVRTFIGRCFRCLRFRAATASQLMGDLPKERVTRSRPFFHTGVDYAGPIYLRTTKGRGHKSTKAYIAVFVCFATKAVHLEAVSDCSTDAFLAAYKRFTSRRGLCRTISSDCGTNFVGADAELRSLFASASAESRTIATALANDGVEWKFNPPSAPHFGGLWEAAVKSVKHHLRRVIGETTLTFEEMATLLAQIEACLNSRPLQALSDDPDDVNALTPGHFLTGAPLTAVPEPILTDLRPSRLSRWQCIQQMRDSFWDRWASEYLHQLQARPKWHRPQAALEIGDLVLVTNELTAPTRWPLARITAAHPGGDGHTRVVTVRTATSTLKRPIAKLCLLSKHDAITKEEV